jgi:hypothetical protein
MAVAPTAVDIGKIRPIAQKTGTAGSVCCQPFSVVRPDLVTATPNPILPQPRAHTLPAQAPDF